VLLIRRLPEPALVLLAGVAGVVLTTL
jgi:hypothetical protein